MDISISLPDEIQTYVEEQVTTGSYGTVNEYFLALVRQDQKRRAQEKLELLLLEGANSEGNKEVTPEFWRQLRDSVLGGHLDQPLEPPGT